MSVTSKALSQCLTRTYIVSGFEKTGVCPLSRDIMLAKIVGDKPGPKAAAKKVGAVITIEPRVVVVLRDAGINLDAARVLCINDDLVNSFSIRKPVPKSGDEWVHGGCLMTADDIVVKIADKEAKRAEKKEQIQKKKKEVAE
ncbi:hypothetical protein DYB32_008823, partial [Aphanomyces invadans]